MIIIGARKKPQTVVTNLDKGKPMNDLKMIAQDMMSAFQSGDLQKLEDSLEAFKEMIGMEDEEQDHEMME